MESTDDTLAVGSHSFRPAEVPDILTAEELAELLRVELETVVELADKGDLPGRRIGGQWRFARHAVLEWLASGREA